MGRPVGLKDSEKRAVGSGRKLGSQNKLSKLSRENINRVFYDIGGIDAMSRWAKNNQTEFYRIYSKLLPIEANIKADMNVVVEIVKFGQDYTPE